MSANRHVNIPASYLVLIRKNQVLLLKRANTGYEDGNYSMIAGHVEPGETFTQCIIREAMEEAGIALQAQDLEVVHVMHRDSGTADNNERIDVFFATHRWAGEPANREPEKCEELSWFPVDNLPENVIPYIRHALDSILRNIYYSEHGWKQHQQSNPTTGAS